MGNSLETHSFLGWKHEATGASGGNLIGPMNSMAHGKCFLFSGPKFPACELGNFWAVKETRRKRPGNPPSPCGFPHAMGAQALAPAGVSYCRCRIASHDVEFPQSFLPRKPYWISLFNELQKKFPILRVQGFDGRKPGGASSGSSPHERSSNTRFASCKSAVSNPSVNQLYTGASSSWAAWRLSCCCQRRARLVAARSLRALACWQRAMERVCLSSQWLGPQPH
jgi:hypothetical protein